jgi:diguanylate cyclase (GGDEF)-like protein/PAS domain S-box-containing protein
MREKFMEFSPVKVLLVDDDEDEFVVTRDLLSDINRKVWTLDWVSRYDEALARVLSGGYDVCLIDYWLGAHTGLDLMREALSQGCQSPLILLTGQGNREIDIAAMEAGAADYLVKGQFSASELERSIRYAISAAKTMERLRISEERYALAARAANDGLWDWNLLTGEVYFAPRWKDMLGYQEHEISNHVDEWMARVHPEDVGHLKAEINAHLEGETPQFQSEYRMAHRAGGWVWMLCRGLAVRDAEGRACRMAGSQTDITARKRAEEKLRHDAHHDSLTGLPNRTVFLDRLARSVSRARRRDDYLFAVLFLDLDRFKLINDSSGHRTGDQLLIAVARRLESVLRPGDMVARHGGDEFTILLDHLKDQTDVETIVRRLEKHLSSPFDIFGQETVVNASIGITLSSVACQDPEQMLRDADIAMYRAKARGRGRYEFFSSGMHQDLVSTMQLESDLRSAIRNGEFLAHYQPIISFEEGRISGFEALIRWQHPQRGLIPPGQFIPVAEESGLINPVGRWILREAARQMTEWQRCFPADPPLIVSVNLSTRQFSQPDLIERISEVLAETGLSPQSLKIEITESAVMENAEAAVEMLNQLKAFGMQLSIDDFGTGYSSFNYLHRFPIDTLKIDRSFVSRMDIQAENVEIVRTIISLAHNLGMKVVAEGIETRAQMQQLRELGCEYGQGYYLARPMDSAAAASIIASPPSHLWRPEPEEDLQYARISQV